VRTKGPTAAIQLMAALVPPAIRQKSNKVWLACEKAPPKRGSLTSRPRKERPVGRGACGLPLDGHPIKKKPRQTGRGKVSSHIAHVS
jgi:hypothetical protein